MKTIYSLSRVQKSVVVTSAVLILLVFVLSSYYRNLDPPLKYIYNVYVFSPSNNTEVETGKQNNSKSDDTASTVKRKYGNESKITAKNVTVLLFNPKYWESKMFEHFDKYSQTCPKKCKFTKDRTLFKQSDAVVFMLDYLTNVNLPTKVPGQVWIFSMYESTDSLRKDNVQLIMNPKVMRRYNDRVNWTWTYRRDADIVFVHGGYSSKVYTINSTWETSTLNVINKKTKPIAIFNSHCRSISKREEYIKELQTVIPVDVFGTCGKTRKNDCPKNGQDRFLQVWGLVNSTCFDMLDNDYHFYLSFENTLCRDYITEKGLHNTVQHKIIPIMRSGVNHSIFNPPKSFIDTNDFKSAKELGSYLKNLLSQKNEMLNFYRWRQYYRSQFPIENWYDNLCTICQRLHDSDKYVRLYNDIYQWFVEPGNVSSCKS